MSNPILKQAVSADAGRGVAKTDAAGSSINDNVHVCRHGVRAHPFEYAGPVLGSSSVLADLVDCMADWDIACPDQARALTLKFIPSTILLLQIHYRAPIAATWQFGSRGFSQPDYRRHSVSRRLAGVLVARPRGALGTICVHLRPEAAASLLGERLRCFDATIGLDDLFGAAQVSLLEEKLSEARTSAERFARMESFLAANLRARRVEPLACRAATLLRRNPHLRISRLAAGLDVTERHLSRNFQAMFGTSPKQFARIARIERVWLARSQGASWADIAYAAGFTDQAHMIHDFTEIVGVSPAQLGPRLVITGGDIEGVKNRRWALDRETCRARRVAA
jgi:AraC-like DNA-binding protein